MVGAVQNDGADVRSYRAKPPPRQIRVRPRVGAHGAMKRSRHRVVRVRRHHDGVIGPRPSGRVAPASRGEEWPKTRLHFGNHPGALVAGLTESRSAACASARAI